MHTFLIAIAAGGLLAAAPVALASDGGQASVDPSSLKRPNCPRLPDDISLGGGLYMCARIDCSPPPGFTEPPGCGSPKRNVVLVPNGDLKLNAKQDGLVQVGGPANGQPLAPETAGGTGYDGGDAGAGP
jgi:hypothetical protein